MKTLLKAQSKPGRKILPILLILLIMVLTNCSGEDGSDGINGADGASGRNGVDGDRGDDGKDGKDCDVEEDGAYYAMICGGAEKARWAKAWCGMAAYDPETQFCDTRDSKLYKYVTIGYQTWMAENLNYKTDVSGYCYDDDDTNCEKYGRLYSWNVANNTVCPNGWHLPSSNEWSVFSKFVDSGYVSNDNNIAGTKLKATSGWNSHANYGNGTDDFGFAALPGGSLSWMGSAGGGYSNEGEKGCLWTTREREDDELGAYTFCMNYNTANAIESIMHKGTGLSVRCIKN